MNRNINTISGKVLSFIDYLLENGFDEECDCDECIDCMGCINQDVCEQITILQEKALKVDSKLNGDYLEID